LLISLALPPPVLAGGSGLWVATSLSTAVVCLSGVLILIAGSQQERAKCNGIVAHRVARTESGVLLALVEPCRPDAPNAQGTARVQLDSAFGGSNTLLPVCPRPTRDIMASVIDRIPPTVKACTASDDGSFDHADAALSRKPSRSHPYPR